MIAAHCTFCGVSREDSEVGFHRNQCHRCQNRRRNKEQCNANNRAKWREHRAAGRCGCGLPKLDGRTKCDGCSRRAREYKQRKRRELRLAALRSYGNTCSYCGEDFEPFLTIDHIANNGGEHRKRENIVGSKVYEWLAKNNYPIGFQVLCAGCNFSKERIGETELKVLLKEVGRLRAHA